MHPNYFVTILAGGIGSRFWPASTEDQPKQFLDILGVGKSLIRLTYERFANIVPNDRILILTNQQYKPLIQEHLPEIPERNILLEPSRNNTGPCIAYAALRMLVENPNAVFVTAPSDHVILKEKHFLDLIEQGLKFAESQQKIVTLGITPTRPDTGYGYIHLDEKKTEDDIVKVESFKEKPDLETAKKYLEAGDYLWNAGIFIWSAKHLVEAFNQNEPQILEVLTQNPKAIGSDQEQNYINKVYPETKNISVDYAILEKSDDVYILPADIGWSDLGTWNSLHSYSEKDKNNNLVQTGQNKLTDVKNCLIRVPNNKQVVVKGLDNYIIVDEENALLIYPKSDEQEIKSVVKELTAK